MAFQKCQLTLFCTLNDVFDPPKTRWIGTNKSSSYESPRWCFAKEISSFRCKWQIRSMLHPPNQELLADRLTGGMQMLVMTLKRTIKWTFTTHSLIMWSSIWTTDFQRRSRAYCLPGTWFPLLKWHLLDETVVQKIEQSFTDELPRMAEF